MFKAKKTIMYIDVKGVDDKYEILTDISEGGIKELQQIERVARVCYKSEDKITPDGESAKKLVGFLVKQGHEAMLEHSQLSVLFTCDRGVANELIRHRIASFAQESTRYCNYSKEKFGGELNFIQPYYIDVTDTDKKRESAEYTPGSTWLDSCESAEILYKDITQLNRSLENNLLKTVEYLTNMAYSQLGITPEIMNGTASDAVMTNYENRTIEPIVAAAVDEIRRKFLTEDDRANRESVMYFRDPFKLTPVSAVAEMADKFTRNEIMTSNEFRQAIGMKPSKDPKADELRNANISQSSEEIAAQNKTITAGRDAVERSIANQNG